MIVQLSAVHVREHLPAYIAVSADVCDWGETQFLSELPDKWLLSFAVWSDKPDAYCIMSRKFGPPHIHQFMVRQDLRGQGIGEKMLAEAVRRGAETLKVAADNEGAIRFYKRHGWAVVKEGLYLWLRCHQEPRIERRYSYR